MGIPTGGNEFRTGRLKVQRLKGKISNRSTSYACFPNRTYIDICVNTIE